MDRSWLTWIPRTACAAIAIGLAACGGPGQASAPPDRDRDGAAGDASPALPVRWTQAFLPKALLTASEVRIEGPRGLLLHVATGSDPVYHARVEKTVPAGFLQEISLLPGAGEVEIRAQLDGLVIAAVRRLSVLERPGDVNVVVTASGDAYWKRLDTGEEKRGASLRFDGPIPR